MSIFGRLKRLWDLSSIPSDMEDEKMAEEIKRDFSIFRKKKKQRLATILKEDPPEFFPIAEEQDNDTTSKQPSAD